MAIGPDSLSLSSLGSLWSSSDYLLSKHSESSPKLTAVSQPWIVRKVNFATARSYNTAIHNGFPKIFWGLGNLGEEYKISLNPDAEPFSLTCSKACATPTSQESKRRASTRMGSLGVITKIDKPTLWYDRNGCRSEEEQLYGTNMHWPQDPQPKRVARPPSSAESWRNSHTAIMEQHSSVNSVPIAGFGRFLWRKNLAISPRSLPHPDDIASLSYPLGYLAPPNYSRKECLKFFMD